MAAIIAGLWAGVFTVGIVNGLMNQRVDYLINSEVTHMQIHHPEFLAEGFVNLNIPDHQSVFTWLEDDERVKSFSPRIITDGMLQSPVKTSGVRIRGIIPEKEMATTVFYENMTSGEFLDSDVRNAIIMGEELASEHNMDIGNRVVLTFEDIDGQLVSALFNISGFFQSASTEYDRRNVWVRSEDINALMSEEPLFHEIGVMFHEEIHSAEVASTLNETFTEIEAQTWRTLSPELNFLVELGGVMVVILTLIIMMALSFGILNTMLMSIFERMRELGMLISIGMSRMRVFSMIMLESLILTFTGALAGILIATAHVWYFRESGINLEMFAQGASQIGWDHHIYPVLTSTEYGLVVSVVVLVAMLSSVYPSIKAVRINPLEASKSG